MALAKGGLSETDVPSKVPDKMIVLLHNGLLKEVDLVAWSAKIYIGQKEKFTEYIESFGVDGIAVDLYREGVVDRCLEKAGFPSWGGIQRLLYEYCKKLNTERFAQLQNHRQRNLADIAKELGVEVEEKPPDSHSNSIPIKKPLGPGPGI